MEVLNDATRDDLVAVMKRDFTAQSSKVLFVEQTILKTFKYLDFFSKTFCSTYNISGIFSLFGENDDAPQASHIAYFLSPNVESTRYLVSHLLFYLQKYPRTIPSIYFAPQMTLMIAQILREEYKLQQLYPNLRLCDFDFDAAYFESSGVFMQQPRIFRHLYVDGDITSLKWMARLLLKLQTTQFGAVRHVRGKGNCAARVVRMLSDMEKDIGKDFLTDLSSQVDNVIVVDRALDLVTPLMTQLTYEGLIDELYDFSACEATFPFPLSEGSAGTGNLRHTILDNNDRIFAEVRDKNFASVGASLYQKSLWVKQSYEKRKEVHQLKELKEFMKGLPEMQEMHRLIGIHTTVATEIGKHTQTAEFRKRILMEQYIIQQVNDKEVLLFIEDLINRREVLEHVLRILCLYSVVNGGLRPREYDTLKEMMMLSYGIPLIISIFFSLEKCGLLMKTDVKTSSYATLRKCFRTWDTALNEQQPTDISYAYSGYSSHLVRLIEMLVSTPHSWNGANNLVDLLPGERAELRHNVSILGTAKTSIVFVIGGITAAEMSAMRFVQSKLAKSGSAHTLLICTTDLVNGNRMIRSLFPIME